MKGIVFDIQRCSLHDGPGVRTTVFLKGCPLRCVWCHNPESFLTRPQMMYDALKCSGCMACAGTCPKGAHIRIDSESGHGLDYSLCAACGACVPVCPNGALKIIGKEMDAGAVMDVVLRDAAYYRASGGGMTLSGGEPAAQFDFTLELLTLAKGHGLHTCMETCGQAVQRKYEQCLPFTDMILFDYKATDPARHAELTGMGNGLILANLDWLYHNGAGILLRCPLVPGINDDLEHLKGIAGLFHRYPKLLGVELLPYHNLGVSKSKKIGYAPKFCFTETVTSEIKQGWLDTLSGYGCEKVFIHS